MDWILVNFDMVSKGVVSRRVKVYMVVIIWWVVCSVIIFFNGKKIRKNWFSVMKKRLLVEINIGIWLIKNENWYKMFFVILLISYCMLYVVMVMYWGIIYKISKIFEKVMFRIK